MKRLLGSLVAFGLLVLAVLLPALFWERGSADEGGYEPTSIDTYQAEFDLGADGDLEVVETITVDFPIGVDRRGIFRFWDRLDTSAPNARRYVEDVEVTMDGDEVELDLSTRDGRYDVGRVGSESIIVEPGLHTYEISYRIPGVVAPGTDGTESQFYWQLIPAGWAQTIDRAELTVRLPEAAESVQCGVGVGEDPAPCDITGEDTDTLVVTTGHLDRNTPVTLKAGLDIPTPDAGAELPWTGRYDRVLGQSLPLLVVVLVLAALAAVAGLLVTRSTREREPQFPLMYAPPQGIGPAQGQYVLREKVDRKAYVATLMHAAQHGAIELEKHGGDWTIKDKAGPQGWHGLDEVSLSVARLLPGPGTSFTASPKSVAAGKRLQTEIADFESRTKRWGRESGLLTKAGLGSLGSSLVLLGFVAAIANVIWNPFGMTAASFVPGGFAILGAGALKTGASTKRTRQGRELWSRIGGFHRVLSTPSSKERFDFSGREELYTAYIPWAVAFDCADEWAAKYRTETGTEPPVPRYFGHAYAGAATGSYVSSMVGDFDSTVSSAISAYQATQSSSSSGGGGGFSGGGGGGGGGGGSW